MLALSSVCDPKERRDHGQHEHRGVEIGEEKGLCVCSVGEKTLRGASRQSQALVPQEKVTLTLPRKLDMVHKNTTHSRRIKPSVCLASPAARGVVVASSGASRSLCLEGLRLRLLLSSSISNCSCGEKGRRLSRERSDMKSVKRAPSRHCHVDWPATHQDGNQSRCKH